MKAKFLRKEKCNYWGYDYYFECIDCGEVYTSMRFDNRTTPYCGSCWRKHNLEKQKIRKEQKKQAEINEVLNKIRVEIIRYECNCRLSTDENSTCKQCNNNVFESIYEILDKYKPH